MLNAVEHPELFQPYDYFLDQVLIFSWMNS